MDPSEMVTAKFVNSLPHLKETDDGNNVNIFWIVPESGEEQFVAGTFFFLPLKFIN